MSWSEGESLLCETWEKVRDHVDGAEHYRVLAELIDLFENDKYGPEKNHFTKEDLGKDEVMLYAMTSEAGTPFCGRIEVEDDHVFDVKLLSFSRISAKIGDREMCEIIEYVMYNDEEVDNDYYETSGKDFELEIIEEW